MKVAFFALGRTLLGDGITVIRATYKFSAKSHYVGYSKRFRHVGNGNVSVYTLRLKHSAMFEQQFRDFIVSL